MNSAILAHASRRDIEITLEKIFTSHLDKLDDNAIRKLARNTETLPHFLGPLIEELAEIFRPENFIERRIQVDRFDPKQLANASGLILRIHNGEIARVPDFPELPEAAAEQGQLVPPREMEMINAVAFKVEEPLSMMNGLQIRNEYNKRGLVPDQALALTLASSAARPPDFPKRFLSVQGATKNWHSITVNAHQARDMYIYHIGDDHRMVCDLTGVSWCVGKWA